MFGKMSFAVCLWSTTILLWGCRDDNDMENDDVDGGGPVDNIGEDEDSNDNDDENSTTNVNDGNWDGDGNVCHDATAGFSSVSSRVMLLQDASGSMADNNKWNTAMNAISGMVQTFEDKIEFGLDLFPMSDSSDWFWGDLIADSGCEVGSSAAIDVALNNGDAIFSSLQRSGPEGGTPLYLGMSNFTDSDYAPVFTNGEASAYLVIISDGEDTCDADGIYDEFNGASPALLAEMTRALREDYGIRTIVVGFGEGADPEQLNAIAAEGGTPFTTFLNASDGDELSAALNQIGETVVVSCAFELGEFDKNNVDLDRIYVAFDGEKVLMNEDCDGGIGWRWTSDSREVMEFCEQSCEEMASGIAVEIKIACQSSMV